MHSTRSKLSEASMSHNVRVSQMQVESQTDVDLGQQNQSVQYVG